MATDDESRTDDLYPVVYRAVHDALWDVLGTAVYALVLAVFFVLGLQLIVFELFTISSSIAIGTLLLGCVLVIGSIVQFLRLFDLMPSLRNS